MPQKKYLKLDQNQYFTQSLQGNAPDQYLKLDQNHYFSQSVQGNASE